MSLDVKVSNVTRSTEVHCKDAEVGTLYEITRTRSGQFPDYIGRIVVKDSKNANFYDIVGRFQLSEGHDSFYVTPLPKGSTITITQL